MKRKSMAKGNDALSSERREPVSAERLLTAPVSGLERETLAWLLLGLFALFVVGFYVMRIPGQDQGNPISFDRALFGSMSTVTLTGMQQVVSASPFDADSFLFPVVQLLLTMGASVIILIATGLPACRVLGMQQSTRRIVSAAVMVILGGTIIGAIALSLGHRDGFGKGLMSLDPYLHAASAISNSGVSMAGRLPREGSRAAHFVLMPLAILGGLGLPVLLDLFDRIRGKSAELLPHTRIVLTLTAGIYLVSMVLLLVLNENLANWTVIAFREKGLTPSQWAQVRRLLADTSLLSLNSRSAGFAFDGFSLAAFPRAVNWALVFLMAIGAGPASTAGGIKTTTLYILWKGIGRGMRGERLAPVTGFAIVWSLIFLTMVGLGTAILLWFAPQTPGELLPLLAVSAASNSGLTPDPVSLVAAPLMVLALLMALGRIVPIVLLWALAERIDYAETIVG